MSDCFDHGFDALESYLYGDDGNYVLEPQPKRCKHCGKEGLYWHEIKGKWRLCNGKWDSTSHDCEDVKIFLKLNEQKRITDMNSFENQYRW